MTAEVTQWVAVQRFLGREAHALDNRDWDSWTALYSPDAEYWVPAWGDDGNLTKDPQTEISLIYYANRGGLEDRVFRIRTERSSATMPLRRTSHMFTLLSVAENRDGTGLDVRTSWMVNCFHDTTRLSYAGSAEYHLIPDGDAWRIKAKKTIVINDIAETMLDVYTI